MSRSIRFLLIPIVVGALTACSATPTATPAPSSSVTPTGTLSASSTPVPAQSPPSAGGLGGYRWTRLDAQQFDGVALEAISTMSDGRVLGVGNWLTATSPEGSPRQPTIWTSADGLSWTRQPDSGAFASERASWEDDVHGLLRARGGFVAVGTESEDDASQADAAAWFSQDGITWSRASVNDSIDRTMDEVVATPRGLVALGEADYSFHAGFGGGTAIWTSPDGRLWTRVSDTVGPPHGTRLRTIVAGPSGFLATATFEEDEAQMGTPGPAVTAGIWTSTDAIHWQPIAGTPLGLNDLIKTSGGYAAVGSGAADHAAGAFVWASPDGRTWSSAMLPDPADLPIGATAFVENVASGPTGFVAFGERDDAFSGLAWSSADGLTWTEVNLDPVTGGAVIDHLMPFGESLVLSGHVDQVDGTRESAAWLLRP